MTREEREEIYYTLRQNMRYNENVGNREHSIRQQMRGMSIPEQMAFVVGRIDNACYGSKVEGNSYDAALYLASKFSGYVLQKVYNDEITHYYVAYLDENENLRVANPASDFINNRLDREGRFDIPFEKFRTKSLLLYVTRGNIVVRGRREYLDIVMTNIYAHNFKIMEGKEPSFKDLRDAGFDPSHITYADLPCPVNKRDRSF